MTQRNYLVSTTALSTTASGTTIGSGNTNIDTFAVARTLVVGSQPAGDLEYPSTNDYNIASAIRNNKVN